MPRCPSIVRAQWVHATLAVIVFAGVTLAAPLAAAQADREGWRARVADRRAARAEQPPLQKLLHGGLERTYFIQGSDHEGPRPLVIALHGGTRSADDILLRSTWPEIAAREGAVLLAPNAVRGVWNDGRSVFQVDFDPSAIDDLGFLATLIDKAVAEARVDPKRVYVTGASNGGNMAWRLACERGGRVAAIAPVISTMPGDADRRCAQAPGTPVIAFFGVADQLMRYDGAPVRTRSGVFTEQRLSAPASTEWWAKRNGCGATPIRADLPDVDPGDATTIQRFTYPDCPAGLEVVRYDVQGGGHIAPGAPSSRVVERLLGKANRDLVADEVSWAFFAGKSR